MDDLASKIDEECASTAEEVWYDCYHQQYLAKNPNGYCGIGGTGMSCPVGVARVPEADPGE